LLLDLHLPKVAQLWETLLTKFPEIHAAYFHNDEMALAAYEVMTNAPGPVLWKSTF
jgi:ribose transport system substrate-binding protein